MELWQKMLQSGYPPHNRLSRFVNFGVVVVVVVVIVVIVVVIIVVIIVVLLVATVWLSSS